LITVALKPPTGGACVGKTELFFSGPTRTREAIALEQQAKRICQTCDKMVECQTYALHHEMFGVWGGMTELERRRERSVRNIIPKPPIVTVF
jgi:hypothetical protein